MAMDGRISEGYRVKDRLRRGTTTTMNRSILCTLQHRMRNDLCEGVVLNETGAITRNQMHFCRTDSGTELTLASDRIDSSNLSPAKLNER